MTELPTRAHGLSEDHGIPWAERVRTWRVQRLLSPEQVGRILGVTSKQVREWEDGSKKPVTERPYVERFRQAQDQAGENPGQNTAAELLELWKVASGGG